MKQKKKILAEIARRQPYDIEKSDNLNILDITKKN